MTVLSHLDGALSAEACPVVLPWFKTRDTRDPANLLRRVALDHWEREAGLGKAALGLGAFLWPVVSAARSIANLRRSGDYVARTFDVPRWRQLVDMLWLANRWNVAPRDYYQSRLFTGEHPPREMLMRHEVAYVLARLCQGLDQGKLDDKARFHEHARAHALPVADTYVVFDRGASRWLDARAPEGVPPVSVVLKATSLSSGRGFERWRFDGGVWRRGDQALTIAALLERARARSADEGRVIVQRALDNHPDLVPIALEALTTLRVVTFRRPGLPPGVLFAGLRIPGPGAVVDNLAEGGAMADVDLARGVLAAAQPDQIERGVLTAHPVTRAPIEGRRVPRWPEPLEVALRAHATAPEWAFVGWDVAITPDRVVLVEANTVWGGCERKGLGGGAFAACALEHLERRAS